MKKNYPTKIILFLICLAVSVTAQTETLTNSQIVEMSVIGLDKQIIIKKINDSQNNFDVSANALIELKKAGVDSEIIVLMMDKGRWKESENPNPQTTATTDNTSQGFSDSQPENQPATSSKSGNIAKDALLNARTVAIEKSSLNPSRQALEKELIKRKEWKQFNLSIVRYKEGADLYIEIGFVPLSLLTHRYVYRVYDRRSGTVIAAGETTSWGSLSKNLARDIGKKLSALATQ